MRGFVVLLALVALLVVPCVVDAKVCGGCSSSSVVSITKTKTIEVAKVGGWWWSKPEPKVEPTPAPAPAPAPAVVVPDACTPAKDVVVTHKHTARKTIWAAVRERKHRPVARLLRWTFCR